MSRLKFLTAVFLFFFATQAIYGQVEHLDSILFAQAKKQLKEDVFNKLGQQSRLSNFLRTEENGYTLIAYHIIILFFFSGIGPVSLV